jgi:hypothetical protein
LVINKFNQSTTIPNFIIFPILKLLNFIVIIAEIYKCWDEELFKKYIDKQALKEQIKRDKNNQKEQEMIVSKAIKMKKLKEKNEKEKEKEKEKDGKNRNSIVLNEVNDGNERKVKENSYNEEKKDIDNEVNKNNDNKENKENNENIIKEIVNMNQNQNKEEVNITPNNKYTIKQDDDSQKNKEEIPSLNIINDNEIQFQIENQTNKEKERKYTEGISSVSNIDNDNINRTIPTSDRRKSKKESVKNQIKAREIREIISLQKENEMISHNQINEMNINLDQDVPFKVIIILILIVNILLLLLIKLIYIITFQRNHRILSILNANSSFCRIWILILREFKD